MQPGSGHCPRSAHSVCAMCIPRLKTAQTVIDTRRYPQTPRDTEIQKEQNVFICPEQLNRSPCNIMHVSLWYLHRWHCFHCVFSNVFANYLPKKMQSYIGCIYMVFLHCVFSNVYSNGPCEMMHSHIGCICLAFLQCVFSNAS